MSLSGAERQRRYRQAHPEKIQAQNRRTKEARHGSVWKHPRFETLDNLEHMTTPEVLQYLMNRRISNRKIDGDTGHVTRCVNYDSDATWSLWLRDLPRADLIRLHSGEKVKYMLDGRPLSIRWLRHKSLTITETLRGGVFPMVIEDIGSWWQFKPLASVLESEGCPDVASLAASLYDRLRVVGVPIRKYFGPGPAAETLLRRFHARDEKDDMAPRVAAVYGGRIECLQAGKFRRLFAYDLNSAYCWALSLAPSIKGWEWVHASSSRFCEIGPSMAARALHPHGMYRVRWTIPNPIIHKWGHGIAPLPQRIGDSLYWLSTGEGWYHACEISAVLESWRMTKGGDAEALSHGQMKAGTRLCPSAPCFEVVEGYEPLTASKASLAFPWAPLAYELRRQESLLKVPLAAMWGKIAARESDFYSPFHAGWVTARVRAEMLRAAMLNPAAIVEIATDCIRSTEPLPLAEGSGLGQWKASVETNCIHIQPGFSTCDQKNRNRGVEGDFIPWEEIRRQIGRRNQLDVMARVPTFMGIGECIQFDRWEDFGRTVDIEYPLRIDRGLADPRGETPGRYQPDPAGPVAGVRRGLPWAREDVTEWI